MPIVFVHGVNTRDTDRDYGDNVKYRQDLLQRRVLNPLSEIDHRFTGMQIVNAYWGAHGVRFHWGMQSLPDVSTIEHLGSEEEAAEADVLFSESVGELAETPPLASADVETLGETDKAEDLDLLCRAAHADLTAFLEYVLTPVLLSQYRITGDAGEPPIPEGTARALLAIACAEVGSSVTVRSQAAACVSDDALMALVGGRVVAEFDALLGTTDACAPQQQDDIEELGRPAWRDELSDRVRELFKRALGAPARAAALPLLQFKRERFNARLVRFLGDVFVYLNERGDTTPGPIVAAVLEAIRTAPRTSVAEPLIVITHSMGGNILYDLVTHFDQSLIIDVWISVGGQVAVFEEMKLFRVSDKQLAAPAKVTGLKTRVKYWANLYDPADALSFRVNPVFADVDADEPYLTGAGSLKAHGEYFGRASFYDVLKSHIRRGVQAAG